MAIKFPYLAYATLANQEWINGADSISFAARVRVDDNVAANSQYIFSFRGASGQYSLRKDTSGVFRLSVTTGGLFKTKDGAATVAQGTIYHVAGSWLKNSATGLRVWENGVEIGSGTDTTAQPNAYETGGGTGFWIACRSLNSNFGRCSVENLIVVRDHVWTLEEVEALRDGVWPWNGRDFGERIFHPLDDARIDLIPDLGSGARHIPSSGIVGAEAGGVLGVIQEPIPLPMLEALVSETAPPPPPEDPWTPAPRVLHPTSSTRIGGLSPGVVYEFRIRAYDAAGNASPVSEAIEVTAPGLKAHVPRKVFFYGRR